MATRLEIKAGCTDPVTLTAGHAAAGDPLENVSELRLYMRKLGAATNKVDGRLLATFTAAGVITWPPLAAEVDEPGTFRAYVRAVRTDSTEVRFPSGADFFEVVVTANYEG